MDVRPQLSARSRGGHSHPRSFGGASYADIRSLFVAAGEFIISTPFAASALYAEDPRILDDPRIATLNTPWLQKTMTAARDRAMQTDQSLTLDNLKKEEETLLSGLNRGWSALLRTES